MSERFIDFLKHLNDPQVRALSSQVGITLWAAEDTEWLRKELANSKEAEAIYDANH